MPTKNYITVSGNQAVADIAYKTNEVFAVYPITPASEMSEWVEQWSAENKSNCFGNVPTVFEMQSESGVAGAMHGALQTGSLASTFTASQGLLLMLPNMYKVAGELTPNVIHVATRSIATHALSVFGDHSDIMAVRQSGYAMLGSASVQEAQDMALIAQAATLHSRIPFVHFFDGFRTSHEINTIESIGDDLITSMLEPAWIRDHRDRALNPNKPIIRGTAQEADLFFQSREAVNKYYMACPSIVQNEMDKFSKLTGRSYKIFDYYGDPEAKHIIISMASSTETIEETIKHLNSKGEKLGLIKVRLFRPFSTEHLIKALPKSCQSIAVLDRTKEPGSVGEPLFLDVMQSITQAFQDQKINKLPKIIGGRYGLSSKEFPPGMVKAIFDHLKSSQPKTQFTIGIKDDVTHLSLPYNGETQLNNFNLQAIMLETKSNAATTSFNALTSLIGNYTPNTVQGYVERNYKKSHTVQKAHLRIGTTPIKAPYLISEADFLASENIKALTLKALDILKSGAKVLINTSDTPDNFWNSLLKDIQSKIIHKNLDVYIVNTDVLQENYNIHGFNISRFHLSILAFNEVLKNNIHLDEIKLNFQKIIPGQINVDVQHISSNTTKLTSSLLDKLLNDNGDLASVSDCPADGTYPSDTSKFNPSRHSTQLPDWQPDACIQCGACSIACPQAALRTKLVGDNQLSEAPLFFKSAKALEPKYALDLLNYTLQIDPDQCTGCNNCVDACESNALIMENTLNIESLRKNWNFFEDIPELDRSKIDATKVSQQQFQQTLFKYPFAVDGCGESPYLKLMSQLFGDRLLVANATGSSSIFGGSLPTTPWSKNKDGKGPAWSNSLFEDNAEFGLGFRLSLDSQEQEAKQLLGQLLPNLPFDLVYDILKAEQITETEINQQRKSVELLKFKLKELNQPKALQLHKIVDSLVKKSVWCIGGDGWAYDIGFSGIDHVLASGKNINILVLDNEVYENTGGQASKATPFGASAKFAHNGKQKQKKDLGRMAMTYDNVYVASVAIGADQEQTLKAFNEAESFDGPSIILAYCHSASHGIDLKHPKQYHKAAVDSGRWLLYRNDPRRLEHGLNPFQLDSKPLIIKIEDGLKKEKRFENLFSNKVDSNTIFRTLQSHIDKRFQDFKTQSTPEPLTGVSSNRQDLYNRNSLNTTEVYEV